MLRWRELSVEFLGRCQPVGNWLFFPRASASVNVFRCFFAEGLGRTPCMRSHIFIHLATNIAFAKPFIFKIKIEKEGLPRDSQAGLCTGGLGFKSGSPEHFP